MQSSSRFRETLVFVAGFTPQIITETIYALSRNSPPIISNDIHIITTGSGKKLIQNKLIDEGILEAMCRDCGLPIITLSENSFHIIKSSQEEVLNDIITEADNEALGNLVTDTLRTLAYDPSNRLHCSIAGGRKTMSYYLGMALQMFGRPWDRLYHVLVSPEFETNRDFYYKPSVATNISTPHGILSTEDAHIHLMELPFIRFSGKHGLKGDSFSELVAEGQLSVDSSTVQPALLADFELRTVRIGDTTIEMLPIQLMFYAAFLRQKLQCCKYPERQLCGDCTGCYIQIGELATREALEKLADDYGSIYASMDKRNELLEKGNWKEGFDPNTIRQNISKLNGAIKEQLNDATLATLFVVTTHKKYAGSRYGVKAEKSRISLLCETK